MTLFFAVAYLTLLQLENLQKLPVSQSAELFTFFVEEILLGSLLFKSHRVHYKTAFSICVIFALLKLLYLVATKLRPSVPAEDYLHVFQYSLAVVVTYLALLISKSMDFLEEIRYFNQFNQERQKNSQINDFINRLMPKHVQEIISNPNAKLAETYENVTIIYADIVGFTSYSSNKKPQ